MTALLTIVGFVVILIGISNFLDVLIYGAFLSDREIELVFRNHTGFSKSYFLKKDSSKIIPALSGNNFLSSFNKSIFYRFSFGTWYFNGIGIIPFWSKWNRYIDNLYNALLSGEIDEKSNTIETKDL